MAERYDFYVHDNRKITFNLTEPIMREDNHVTDWVIHIPKTLNELEASEWSWCLVYVNAKGEKRREPLELSDDPESPLEKNIGTYSVDYGMSIKAGTVLFAIEGKNADTSGTVLNEWHTYTYEHKVKETIQGDDAEYDDSQKDVMAALIVQVQTKMNQVIGGATPTPVASVSAMTDPSKLYLLTTDGNWYYHNGTTFVSGGVYGAGVVDAVPTQGSTNAVSSGGVYDALANKAPAIIAESESGYNHTDANITSVKFYGDAYAWKNARYANKKNYLPPLSGGKTTYGVTFTFVNGFLIYNGTSTGNGTYDVGYIVDVEIPAGTYTILCEIHKGETTITTGRVPNITVTYEDDTTENVTLPSATYTDVSGTVTFAKAVKRMNIKAGLRSGNVYSDYRMWYGVYPSDVHIVDTEIAVADGEVYTTSIDNIPIVNTMQHASKVVALADTKEYVDNHLPSYDFDEIVYSRDHYLSPEMYGAIGDGTTDDTTAVLACIADAKMNNKSVRGYGNYAISSPIEISGENADVFLKRINYSGSDCAVKISGVNHNLK
ncbi:MAG: hypothetical protein VZR73_10870, partial [Acutalibacteraceae bacterium]|nr:hypothetical protein [Acutalibacteraceae bacterium]